MEHHDSLWTTLLRAAGLAIPDEIVMTTFVALLLVVLALLVRRRLSVDRPSHFQQLFEVAISGFVKLLEDTIPHHARRHLPLLGTLAFFILTCNLLGLVPAMTAATASASVTLALAIISFTYYNAVAVREVGAVKHVKHLFGPVLVLAPLMFPIELVAHLARNVSLSMRLFGNMFGEHAATGVFLDLVPYVVPLPMMALGLLGAFLQTFIFTVLSMVYIALATEH
jgi:F-type H+-transporting ATPase subunit a